MYTWIQSSALVVVAGLLTGCGGGGGGGSSNTGSSTPTASLNAANQNQASQDVSSTSLSLFVLSQTALGAATTSESTIYASAFAHRDQLPRYFSDASANATATGVVQSSSYACTAGTYTVSVNDADNSSTATAGDSVSITFNNCDEGSGPISGSLGFHIDALSGTYGAIPSNVGVTMTFSNLGIVSSGYTLAINGNITVSGGKTGTNALTQSLSSSSLTVSGTYAGTTRSRTLSNYIASETRSPDANYTYLSRFSVTGTLSSSGFGATQAVTFSTPSTIIRRGTETYPYTGVLLIGGANNSKLRLTAVSNIAVQEELDANGDGFYESSGVVLWNTLL